MVLPRLHIHVQHLLNFLLAHVFRLSHEPVKVLADVADGNCRRADGTTHINDCSVVFLDRAKQCEIQRIAKQRVGCLHVLRNVIPNFPEYFFIPRHADDQHTLELIYIFGDFIRDRFASSRIRHLGYSEFS